ncbi:MAG: DNA-processing protein DprA [Oscillospiraceae bacterium]|nr:DNA-processing protein DprA [Oscillospiraceae bacterium]
MNKLIVLKQHDKSYPEAFSIMQQKPEKIYCIGDINLLNKPAYAVIGTRDCSLYGTKVAMSTAAELVKNNYVVISGLAKGIDTYAHVGALNAAYKNKLTQTEESMYGNTIAVLGSGFNNIYPSENSKLAKQIVDNGGLLISEYAPDIVAKPTFFIRRNSIIAALSKGVIVVEAKKKSGTFTTVDYALEYCKEVYAVPGNVLSPKSTGTNQLIKEGAMVYTGIDDLYI